MIHTALHFGNNYYMNIGSTDTVGSPNNKGFHHFYGYTSQENAHNYYPPFLWRNDVNVDNKYI